jgi:Flp pilus assembly protein TadD
MKKRSLSSKKTLRLRPGDAEAHNGLGFALMKQGKVSKAITHFQEAVKLQPQNTEMRSNLEAALRSLNTVPADSGNR